MGRVAILADIHGNVPALEAVIKDIAEQRVEEVIVAGDLVGRGPQGAEVIDRVKALGWPCVRGNHEDYMLGFLRREVPEEWWHQPVWSASVWMTERLTHHQRFMEGLPFSLVTTQDPTIRVVHGSPTANNEGIGPWTDDDVLQKHYDAVAETTLVCAHTHRPLLKPLPTGGQVVNVGSVGMPFNGDWRAQYALFDPTGGLPVVTFRQVPYDRQELLDLYESSGFLAEGGVTAHLLRIEIQTAKSHLVPFLKWAQTHHHAPTIANIPLFLESV